MPNWTYNTITVTEGTCDLRKFISEHNDFDFNLIIPEPKSKEQCIVDYGEEYIDKGDSHLMHDETDKWFNWYSWHCNFWGTKWNACHVCMADDGSSVDFDTAWAAPEPIFKRLSEMYPTCIFTTESEYEDGGYWACEWRNGKKYGECYEEGYEDEDEVR